MKLNFECVRDVLLFLEEELQLDDFFEPILLSVTDIHKTLTQYKAKEIYYTLKKLSEEEYILAKKEYKTNNSNIDFEFYGVSDITFKGHQYLNSIRDNK